MIPLQSILQYDEGLSRNSLDFRTFKGHCSTSQAEVVVPPSILDTAPLDGACSSIGNYRFSNSTCPIVIVVSASEECSVAARFFCTRLLHYLKWGGESAKLFVCEKNFNEHRMPRYESERDEWLSHVRRCVHSSIQYFDSDPVLGFAATPVSILYADCESDASVQQFHLCLPSNRQFLVRHIWFGEDWTRHHSCGGSCGFIDINLRQKSFKASRCRGSVVCSSITSFLNNILDSIHHVFLHEPSEGDPLATMQSFAPIFFTRHGQSEYNLEDRLGGDPELTESGRSDAAAIAHFFEEQVRSNTFLFAQRDSEWDAHVGFEVWCSQLRRTRHTAQPSADVLSGGQAKVYKSLNEIHAGICEDMTNEEVKLIYPYIQSFRHTDKVGFRYPNGESYRDLVRRLTPLLMCLSNMRQCVLVVAHQAVLRSVLFFFGGAPVEKAVHVPCPHRTVWVCTYNRVGEPQLCEITLPPRCDGNSDAKWSGW